ncbi:uncharacterized protein EV422DRAFT_533950 [Fimicolochytrium jonesii]|uniref:uncharacterized protein n=1 Tax=Fimicolochytrium jonesii TaxID=1396493 RepID=UPI0022FE446E|nr:uncharacterized protein EV422DRAFT_533950 [Fimicolochytrium jonesii]KAI8819691.1 hypothetical protein EV422DRAFT_533950 [Fimicolochytrium jonesii]
MSVEEIVTPAAPAAATAGKQERPVKPDQATYEKTLKEIDNNIETLKKKHAEAQQKLNGTDNINDAYADRRKEFRTALDDLIKESNAIRDNRQKLIEKQKQIQEGLRARTNESKSSKDRLGYKSVEDVEKQILTLERQQQSGELSLLEEKRIVAEISNLKKSKKILEGLAGQQSSVEADKALLDEIRKQVDALNPERTALQQKIDAVKAKLAEVDTERKGKLGTLNELRDDRKAAKAELDAEFEKRRALKAEHKKLNDEWYAFQREEQARKREVYQAKVREDREARLAVQAEREREAAEIPAYTDEINQCITLIRLLDGSKAPSTTTVTTPAATTTNIRKVSALPEGAVLVKKQEEDFMVLGGGKKGKKGPKRPTTSDSPTPATIKPFKLDFDIIDQFQRLKITLPTSAADVPEAIKALEEKKKWYEDHQAEATEKAKAAAEAKVAALRRGEEKTVETAVEAEAVETA